MCPWYPVGEFGCRLHRRCDDRNLLIKIADYPIIHEAKNSITDLAEMIEVSLRMLVVQLPPDIYTLANLGAVANSEIIKMLWRQWIMNLPATCLIL